MLRLVSKMARGRHSAASYTEDASYPAKLVLFLATIMITTLGSASTASALCTTGGGEAFEATTVNATAVSHPGHTWSHPGYTTLDVTTTGTKTCISTEESIEVIKKEISEESTFPDSLTDSLTVSEGPRTVYSTSWEVREPGKAEEVDVQGVEGEPPVRIQWSCQAPNVVGSYVVTAHGQAGPTISGSGQFPTVSSGWCAKAKKREALALKRRKERHRREAERYRREKPKREAEKRRKKARERQEDSSSSGGKLRAEHAIERAVREESDATASPALIQCRRTGPSRFYCTFEESPSYGARYDATVTFSGTHTYVGPIRETQ